MLTTTTVTTPTLDLQSITPDQVVRAYSGRAGKCTCGCAGSYYERAEEPGQTTRVLRMLQAFPAGVRQGRDLDDRVFFSADMGARRFTVYTTVHA